jgi:hypothetical protein
MTGIKTISYYLSCACEAGVFFFNFMVMNEENENDFINYFLYPVGIGLLLFTILKMLGVTI